MAHDASDKRDFLRIPFETEVEIDTGSDIIRSHKGINLSMSGLHLIAGGAAPAVGTACRVSVILQESADRIDIKAGGKIIRSGPEGLAVEFSDLDLDSYIHLRELILNNTDDPEQAEREFASHWGIRRPTGRA